MRLITLKFDLFDETDHFEYFCQGALVIDVFKEASIMVFLGLFCVGPRSSPSQSLVFSNRNLIKN
jgi:hypothetical protein